MTRISSTSTVWYKRGFPAIWFGGVGFICCVMLAVAFIGQNFGVLGLLFVPIFMGVGGYLFMKRQLFDLVDEVWDGGDYIIVKNRGREHRFALSDFMNLSYGVANPPRITLSLREPSDDFGIDIAFMPELPSKARSLFASYSMPPFARDLMIRIDKARSSVGTVSTEAGQ